MRSAGSRCGSPGAEVPKAWRTCVAGWDEPHAARKVTEDDVAWATVIVVTQRSHAEAVQAMGATAPVILRKIQDPAFCPVATWPGLTSQIEQAALDLVAEIEQAAQGV